VFNYYSKFEPLFKNLYQKYAYIKYLPAANKKIISYKINKISIFKLKKFLENQKKEFIFKISQIKTPELLRKLQLKLKLSYTNDIGINTRDYLTIGLNIKIPLDKETENITILKHKLIASYNSLQAQIFLLASKLNQTYYQFYNTSNSIRLKLNDISHQLIKLKNGIYIDYDKLTKEYLNTFAQIDTLNNLLNQNLQLSAKLYVYLKDINEY
jgi:hypothetical protein